MKAIVMVSGVDVTEYLAPDFEDIKAVMTDAEKDAATVKGWLIKGVEPGSDEVYAFRLAADHAPADIENLLLEGAEIDCRGVVARGWVPRGQTKGSVDAKVTFQAVAVVAVDKKVLRGEMQRRQAQTKQDAESRQTQRTVLERLRTQIDERLKGSASVEGGKAGK